MSDKPETLSAILAEMRDGRSFRLDGADVTWCLLLNLADRIDAAAERERDEDRQLAAIAESDESFARCARCDRPERAPGNAAALRDALEQAKRDHWYDMSPDLRNKIFAALAAPPRNCDKGFRDIEEYRLAFKRECQSHEDCAGCAISKTDAFKNGVLCFFTWLLSADEGGAE